MNIEAFLPTTSSSLYSELIGDSLSTLDAPVFAVFEFCEVIGPKVIYQRPENVDNDNRIDSLAIWLSCSAHFQSLVEPLSNTLTNIDMQIYTSNVSQGINAFTHHFTLLDACARGFIRSFCIAYLVPSNFDMSNYLLNLANSIKTIVNRWKQCNLRHFKLCLDKILLSIEQLMAFEPSTDEFIKNNFLSGEQNNRISKKLLENIVDTIHSALLSIGEYECALTEVDNNCTEDIKNVDNLLERLVARHLGKCDNYASESRLPYIAPCCYEKLVIESDRILENFVTHKYHSSGWPNDNDPVLLIDNRCVMSKSSYATQKLKCIEETESISKVSLLTPMLSSALPRLLGSLWSGGTCVISSAKEARYRTAQTFCQLIARTVVHSPSHSNLASPWHQGEIVPFEYFAKYKIIGIEAPGEFCVDKNICSYIMHMNIDTDQLRSNYLPTRLLNRMSRQLKANIKGDSALNDDVILSKLYSVASRYALLTMTLHYLLYTSIDDFQLNYKKLEMLFNNPLRLKEGDLKIINNWVEMIRQEYTGDAEGRRLPDQVFTHFIPSTSTNTVKI